MFLIQKVGLRYAKALWSSIPPEKREPVLYDLEYVESISRKSPMLVKVLSSPFYRIEIKRGILRKLFKGRIENDVLKLVELLLDRNKFPLIFSIHYYFRKIFNREYGIEECLVEVAHSDVPELLEKIERFIKRRTGASKLIIKEKINPELIGGFILYTDTYYVDASIKTQLQKYRS